MLKFILFPFSLIYGSITAIRNILFNCGLKKSTRFNIPVICVGNITVGGTGKTPFVEFLIRALQDNNQDIAILSRGYGRKTRGWKLATQQSTANEIGDEPCQLKQKFPNTTIAVCESRVAGINDLLQLPIAPKLIVLDDAFQHRAVQPSFSILLMDYNRPLWKDTPFPGGRLREFARGRKRAQMVVVTKCPANLSEKEKNKIVARLQPIEMKNIYFSHISYAPAQALFTKTTVLEGSIVALTGIASPTPFINYLLQKYQISEHLSFPDHHLFSDADITRIIETAQKHSAAIVTTEKDAMRLQQFAEALQGFEVWYIPIQTEIERHDDLLKAIKNHCQTFI